MAVEGGVSGNDAPVGDDAAQTPAPTGQVVIESRHSIATKKITVWLLFGAVFSLTPLFALAMKELLGGDYTFFGLLKHGDAFIVAAVLAAAAMGELLAAALRGGLNYFAAIVAGFFCLALFAGNTIAYMVAASGAKTSVVALCSLWFFPLTVLASGSCITTAAYG